jgi:acetyl-CoA carboxylase beta subunit
MCITRIRNGTNGYGHTLWSTQLLCKNVDEDSWAVLAEKLNAQDALQACESEAFKPTLTART